MGRQFTQSEIEESNDPRHPVFSRDSKERSSSATGRKGPASPGAQTVDQIPGKGLQAVFSSTKGGGRKAFVALQCPLPTGETRRCHSWQSEPVVCPISKVKQAQNHKNSQDTHPVTATAVLRTCRDVPKEPLTHKTSTTSSLVPPWEPQHCEWKSQVPEPAPEGCSCLASGLL